MNIDYSLHNYLLLLLFIQKSSLTEMFTLCKWLVISILLFMKSWMLYCWTMSTARFMQLALNVAKPGHVLLACSFCQVLGQSLITFRVVWKILLEHRPSRMSASLVWSTYNMYCVHKALFRFIFTLVTWGRTNRLVGATLLPLGMNPKNI